VIPGNLKPASGTQTVKVAEGGTLTVNWQFALQ
jgi:hypothetical protein